MSDAFSPFNKETARWFETAIGPPTPVQREGWPAIAAGGHVLVSAPTGTGKTLCAFLVFVDRLKAMARLGELSDALHLIYISPLKSLGNDIRENLKRPNTGIEGPELRVAIRTGDTTPKERRQMLAHPPQILITTPESLYLLLTSRSGRHFLQTARAVIVDELHALIDGKRGAHLMLSLARLDALCGAPLQRIGLSATVEPLETAARYLAAPDPVTIIAPKMEKAARIEVNSPLPDMRVLPEGSIWPELARSVYERALTARAVIAFVEGRAQAERLAHGVNLLGGEGFARTHHGCVSKEQRLEAERSFRAGELRVLCATSSMELGIDVGDVDLVLQIGFPRTVSGAMQRLGRAGHNPGRVSVMHMFPHTAAESIFCGLTARAALDGGMERARPARKCLDVLAQHLVSMAVDGGYTVEEAMAVLSRAEPFFSVTRQELTGVLCMLAGDFEHQHDRPARPRVLYDRIHGVVSGDAYSRMLALSAGGTIPDRGMFPVRTREGTHLGELDEEYVFEARVGDKFLLGAFAWRIGEIRKDAVVVMPTTPEGAQSPFWKGDGSGRPYQTGLAFGRLWRELGEAHRAGTLIPALKRLTLDNAAADNAYDVIDRQMQAVGCLADDTTMVVEHYRGQSGECQVMVHSAFGGQVNAGLALLVCEEARRLTGLDINVYDNDDGFLLQPYASDRDLPEGLLLRVQPETARERLSALLPATPLFNMAFRYNAGRALLMGVRQGKRVPLWVQRIRGAQALGDAALRPDHPLMVETRRECMEAYWDIGALEEVLRNLRVGAISVREVHLPAPSPLSLPFRRAVEAELMYNYYPTPTNALRAAEQALSGEIALQPEKALLEKAAERAKLPGDARQLHALLMAEGDLTAGVLDVPVQWLTALAEEGRALYIEPGLWIAAEHEAEYQAALEAGDAAAQARVLRRCLRYRGTQSQQTLRERYLLPEPALLSALSALLETAAILDGGFYYHKEIYGRAQRATLRMRREQIETAPRAHYQALLARAARVPGDATAQLCRALQTLARHAYPAASWESVLLPQRVPGYRAAMLDALLADGAFYWRADPSERTAVAFYPQEAADWNLPPLARGAPLSEAERVVADALERRGASFAQSLSGVLPGGAAASVLQTLAEKGLAHADSFAPVRRLAEREETEGASLKARARARVGAALGGRWELSRETVPETAEQALERQFDRARVLCLETIRGIPWGEALNTLRVWEYVGRVRRGYFVEGLSGAQFVREADFAQVVLSLREAAAECLWFSAADPAQQWGRALPHLPGRQFLCVPGTAVGLLAGEPVAVLERGGQTLRVFDESALEAALCAFARDFQQKRVFCAKPRVTVKHYPPEAATALEKAGFARQMLDYELWRKR